MTDPHEVDASGHPVRSPEALADAVRVALAPYAWRGFTTTAVVALAVGAVDEARRGRLQPASGRACLHRPTVPATRDDERIGALALRLDLDVGQRWRGMTLREVARRLVAGLAAVEERNLWIDLELAWLLEPPA